MNGHDDDFEAENGHDHDDELDVAHSGQRSDPKNPAKAHGRRHHGSVYGIDVVRLISSSGRIRALLDVYEHFGERSVDSCLSNAKASAR